MKRAALLVAAALVAAAPGDRVVRTLDLATPMGIRTPWRITVTQGAPVDDPIMAERSPVPGALTLCLSRGTGACDPQPGRSLRTGRPDDLFDAPHELHRLAVVRPRADRPLLLVQIGSLHSANGDQRVGTELYGYDRAADRFRAVFRAQTGRNNNQEIRYIDAGPLAGAIVAAEPTADAPFAFWITVSRLGAAGYAPVLRYRSATRYGDGNPLAVIDSEMPGIHRRLNLWRPGRPLPLPPAGCARPRLIHDALWCSTPPTGDR